MKPPHKNKRTKTIQTWLILKVLESIKTFREKERKGGKTRTWREESFKRKGEKNQWASLLFGDKQVQESSFVICSVVCLVHIHILARRDFEVFLQHMSICRLYPLIVVLLCLNNLKAKLSVEVNCRLIADLDMPMIEKCIKVNNNKISSAFMCSPYKFKLVGAGILQTLVRFSVQLLVIDKG